MSERKESLRARMRRARRAVPAGERAERAARIERSALAVLEGARTVMVFYAFGTEVATRGLVRALHHREVRLLLPFLTRGTMEAAEVGPGEALDPSAYGPREPVRRVAVDPGEVDAMVVPGLAFDRRGHRVGYGEGHYDRYLTRLRPDALSVGVAFAFQVVDEVPSGPGDVAVDVVVTEDEVIRARGA
ncbi:MAG TPA: 5-formyltetrahydrofolate cyclo-ligase [Actinomycetota bacterium]